MALQDSLTRKTSKLKRRLFDHSIKILGREVDVVKIDSVLVRKYDFGIQIDEKPEIEIFNNTLTAIISYPTEIPLQRFRYFGSTEGQTEHTGTFFYEVLPIEIWFKFDDKVNEQDYIIHMLHDEEDRNFNIVLKIEDTMGSFANNDLVWKKHLCSIYNGALPDFIQNKLLAA